MTDLFRYVRNWVLAVSWHIAMVLTGRPQAAYLSDRWPTFISFFLTYMAAGVLRCNVTGGDLAVGFGALLFNLLLVFWIMPRSWPKRMATTYLVISTTVDLVGSALVLLGLPPQILHFAGVFELVLMYRAYFLWKKTHPSK